MDSKCRPYPLPTNRKQVPARRGRQLSTVALMQRLFNRRPCPLPSALIPLAATMATCLLVLAVPLSSARVSAPAAQQPIQASANLVKVDVSVMDSHGNFVGGLEQKNFRILDNGADQPLIFFAPVDAPARIVLMIETSPAVYLIHSEHLAAAYALLNGLDPDDQVALVTYNRVPRVIAALTSDKSALLSALGEIHYDIGMGDLNFYDSLSAVLDWFASSPGKRALVLLTTGLDSSPPDRWEALTHRLQGEDAVIFPVALGGPLRGHRDKKPPTPKAAATYDPALKASSAAPNDPLSFARADQVLLTLAAMTGGHAYFPQSANDFLPMYKEIASALRHQYVLGIAPAHDGQFHSLSVSVAEGNAASARNGSKNARYRVLAREGYLAPGP